MESKLSQSGVTILNDRKLFPATNMNTTNDLPKTPMNINQSTLKLPNDQLTNTDHYVLTTIKGEQEQEGSEEIAFQLANPNDMLKSNMASTNNGLLIIDEVQGSGDEEDDDEADFEIKTEKVVEHVCGKCYKTFRRFGGLQKHIKFCRFDNDYDKRKAEMLKNIEKIEKEAVAMEKKDICFCCGDNYDTLHLGLIRCPSCPKSFKTQASYERHYFLTHSELDDFPCDICNAKLRTGPLLKLHKNQHVIRGKPFACNKCGKDFTRQYHLKRHIKGSQCGGTENDMIQCKVCSKTFLRLDNLRSHLKQHLGTTLSAKKSEYSCPYCKKCFFNLSTLNIHIRTHTGEKPFPCDLCDKRFSSLIGVKKHRRYHTGEKPYECSVCSQCFAVKEVLNRHMKRHTGERKHVCGECGRGFIQASQLKNHIHVHLRPFDCAFCDEKFKTEKQLINHSFKHSKAIKKSAKANTASTLYECQLCNLSFKSEANYERHLLSKKHREAKNATAECSICFKKFDNIKSLEFHILKDHDFCMSEDGEESAEFSNINSKEKFDLNNANENTTIQLAKSEVIEEYNISEIPESIIDDNGLNESKEFSMLSDESTSIGNEEKLIVLDNATAFEEKTEIVDINEHENIMKDQVLKLLELLVDEATLKKFGWPYSSEEEVLRKVIENCGHDMSDFEFDDHDYVTRMREYVKLMFTVVIPSDAIQELLNNFSIDEVIEYVLSNNDAKSDGDGESDEIL